MITFSLLEMALKTLVTQMLRPSVRIPGGIHYTGSNVFKLSVLGRVRGIELIAEVSVNRMRVEVQIVAISIHIHRAIHVMANFDGARRRLVRRSVGVVHASWSLQDLLGRIPQNMRG